MTTKPHRTEAENWGPGRVANGHGFCDFHLLSASARVVIVNSGHDGTEAPLPLVTVLGVRGGHHAGEVAAWVTEVLSRQAAATAPVPVRVYHHDPHGNIHSWSPATPHRLIRERPASVVGAHRREPR